MSIKETVEAARFPVHKSGGYQVVAVDELLTDVISQSEALEDALAAERSRRGALEVEIARLRADLDSERHGVAELESRLGDALAAADAGVLIAPVGVESPENVVLRARVEELENQLDNLLTAPPVEPVRVENPEVVVLRERVKELESLLIAALATPPDEPTFAENPVDVDLRAEVTYLRAKVEEFQGALNEAREQARADEEHIASMEAYSDDVEQRVLKLKAERDKVRADAEVALLALSQRLAEVQDGQRTPPTVDIVQEPQMVPEDVVETELAPKPVWEIVVEPESEQPPAPVDPSVDPNEDSRIHQTTPSIVSPSRPDSGDDDDMPSRPRLMRRG